MPEASSIPVTAAANTTSTAMIACQGALCANAREIGGAITAPPATPPRKAGQAQDPDDEALPVPGNRERRAEGEQDQVEEVAGHANNL